MKNVRTFTLALVVIACSPALSAGHDAVIQAGSLVCPSQQALSDAIQAGWETPVCRLLPQETRATVISEERGEIQVRIQGESADVFVQARSVER